MSPDASPSTGDVDGGCAFGGCTGPLDISVGHGHRLFKCNMYFQKTFCVSILLFLLPRVNLSLSDSP